MLMEGQGAKSRGEGRGLQRGLHLPGGPIAVPSVFTIHRWRTFAERPHCSGLCMCVLFVY